jgi:hypothetical protein
MRSSHVQLIALIMDDFAPLLVLCALVTLANFKRVDYPFLSVLLFASGVAVVDTYVPGDFLASFLFCCAVANGVVVIRRRGWRWSDDEDCLLFFQLIGLTYVLVTFAHDGFVLASAAVLLFCYPNCVVWVAAVGVAASSSHLFLVFLSVCFLALQIFVAVVRHCVVCVRRVATLRVLCWFVACCGLSAVWISKTVDEIQKLHSVV